MERKTVCGTTLILLAASILTLTFHFHQGKAESATTLAAPYILDGGLVPGSIFRADITVADVQLLHGFQFVLSYDTNVLTSVGYGLYLPFTVFMPSEINDESGYVALAAITYFGDSYGLATIDATPIGAAGGTHLPQACLQSS